MILKSFQILAICSSMVNPSTFHYEQPKKADEINYSFNIEPGTSTTLQRTEISNSGFNINRKYSIKYQKTVNHDSMLVNAYHYIETYTNYINSEDAQITFLYENRQTITSNDLVTLQISPYKNLKDNLIRLNLYIYLADGVWTEQYVNYYRIKTDIYSSVDTNMMQFIDRSNFASAYANYDVIQQINNAQNGFLYTKTTTETNYNKNTFGTVIQIQANLVINPNETNFIFIDNQLLKQNNEEQDGTPDTISTNNGTSRWCQPNSENAIQLSGKYIPNIQNYEVIDLPGVMWEVLTMPFTFISIAFNLTLFPNTPYQVNLSNLFLSILGALVFIFILKTFVFKK